MSQKVRHVLGISGGKDSAALAIYMKDNYPELDIEYYSSDTGKELEETYELIRNLESYLGKKIHILRGAENSEHEAFDHFLKQYSGYLPSSQARWCTKKLKLEPFERFIGNDLVISYVGIRGDEEREGYISKKSNIQSIFPFRQNIWSEDVVAKFLSNSSITMIQSWISEGVVEVDDEFIYLIGLPISPKFPQNRKASLLLNADVKSFNKLVFRFLQSTSYPLAQLSSFPLVENKDVLVKKDIFSILRNSGVGVPKYYEEMEFEVNGQVGHYSRSRSGCYFCFFQQKIEWVWLLEQHPELYAKAIAYEKEGYAWNERETLTELMQPERVQQIKADYIKREAAKKLTTHSMFLLDILDDSNEEEGCAACFI